MTGVKAVKESPILFTPENAQLVHEGTKTQTRRILQKPDALTRFLEPFVEQSVMAALCPYGIVGDRLWVREQFYIDHFDYLRGPLPKKKPPLDDGMLIYRAEGTCCEQFSECDCAGKGARWRPSIHMPKWACRSWLELTQIRVERLQEISETDAIAEGCCDAYGPDFHVGAYRTLWESIHGAGSWKANPLVWCLTFRKVPA